MKSNVCLLAYISVDDACKVFGWLDDLVQEEAVGDAMPLSEAKCEMADGYRAV